MITEQSDIYRELRITLHHHFLPTYHTDRSNMNPAVYKTDKV